MTSEFISLDHGSGGKIAHRLTADLLLPPQRRARGGELAPLVAVPLLALDQPVGAITVFAKSRATVLEPPDSPGGAFAADVGTPSLILEDDFENDLGWTTASAASSGAWQRGIPVNDSGWEYDPVSDADGSGKCWRLCTILRCRLTITRRNVISAWSNYSRKSQVAFERKKALTPFARSAATSPRLVKTAKMCWRFCV